MQRIPYRLEAVKSSSGKTKYFLIKSIKIKGKKRNIRKYLGMAKPSEKELEKLRRQYSYELENEAAKEKARLSASSYSSNYLSNEEIRTIEEIQFIYDALRDMLTTSEIDAYETKFEMYYIHGTTQIEGNTLSLQQALNLLQYDSVPREKSMREINEVQNFRKVIQYRNKYKGKVTLDFIKKLHGLIMNNIDLDGAGSFRRVDNVVITGCDLRPSPALMIEADLQDAIDEYYSLLEKGKHPFEQAIIFHYKFEMIHPFTDGNGRVGREVLNYMLTRSHYPRLLFLGKDRNRYIQALEYGDDGKYEQMISIFADIVKSQRLTVLRENLKNATMPKKGQTILTDFFSP